MGRLANEPRFPGMAAPTIVFVVLTGNLDPSGTSKKVLALLWAAITGSGIAAGRSSKTSDGTGVSWLERLGGIAPMVFVAGYLLILAALLVEISRPVGATEAYLGMVFFSGLAWLLSRRKWVVTAPPLCSRMLPMTALRMSSAVSNWAG